ncbi:MAG: biotin-dependent carboxyltransferase family protein [Flavobacteriaceae bacterium]|nr:biotin-dependent carboxyltransferase family protein [Flavobacteriaceae bacterium]
MNSYMLILSAGLQTSIQDLGRKGYRSYGVPISGAMDKYSAILANKLLNNKEGLPVMEITITGPKIMFEDKTMIVITGANISPMLNGKPIMLNFVYEVNISDVLSFGKLVFGSRAYLGIKDGFKTEFKLKSFSYYEGITSKCIIEKGDRLKISSYNDDLGFTSSKLKVKESHFETNELEVTKGPEYNRLSKKQREFIFSTKFTIDNLNNRMGYQLKNKLSLLKNNEIITSATIPGSVQLTPSGKLIIMMRDCPTTGGYPRILQLTDLAINQLAQKKTGETFKFKMESSFSFLSRLVNKFKD